ncbi:phosphopantetheine-binding protein [Alcaligenaceae bacterium C4P045]|nr:phosphopantetheine-binding protein [Alcaligenaceae bacterium C4P045]
MTDIASLTNIVATTGLVDDMSRFDSALPFSENGIDSLDVMTLLLAIEENQNIKFSEDEFADIRSLGDVQRILSARGE